MNQTNSISLQDGRTLGYAEYGVAEGFSLLFFHGLPGSRLEAAKLHQAALKMKVRLIGLDRPGMGLSSLQKNRTVLAWADDVNEFATALHLKTFSIIGHSGGAPYVCACAYRLPEKVHRAVIVSGMAPLTSPEAISSLSKPQKQMNWMIQYVPIVLKWMMGLSVKALDNPKRLNSMFKQLPDVDKQIFQNPSHKEAMILSIKEAFRQNANGVVVDFKLLSKPWGFALDAIDCPLVIWQGGCDQQAPVKHAEIFAQQVPNANYNFLDEEGHISLLHHYGEQIVASAL